MPLPMVEASLCHCLPGHSVYVKCNIYGHNIYIYIYIYHTNVNNVNVNDTCICIWSMMCAVNLVKTVHISR